MQEKYMINSSQSKGTDNTNGAKIYILEPMGFQVTIDSAAHEVMQTGHQYSGKFHSVCLDLLSFDREHASNCQGKANRNPSMAHNFVQSRCDS